MVHAARFPSFDVPRLDFNRIFGYATAIAVHGVLLLLLLIPITAPPLATTPDHDIVVVPLTPKVEPIPQIPVHAKVTPAKAHPAPERAAQVPQPIDDTQQIVVDEDVVTNPVVAPVGDTIAPNAPTAPLPGVQLEYAQAPAPAYPRDALRDGVQGTVMLRVLVDVDGRPLDVQVERSSGNRSLDRAAREQVLQRWRFRPATQAGRTVQAIGLVPVDFRLN